MLTKMLYIQKSVFDDGRQFKDVLIKYLLAERKEIKFIKNEKKYIGAKCIDQNCLWKMFAFLTGLFHVKMYHKEHTCTISLKNKRVTSS